MSTISQLLMILCYTESQRAACSEGFVEAGVQSEDDASSSIASQLTQAAAEAVKKSDSGLEGMLVRHMMHAMQLGGPSGTISITSTPHDYVPTAAASRNESTAELSDRYCCYF